MHDVDARPPARRVTALPLARVAGCIGQPWRSTRVQALRALPVHRLSRREQVLCVCLLTMILCISTAGAWLTWRALADEQVQLQGQSAAKADEHRIETDLAKRDSFELTKPTAQADGKASTERPGGSDRSTPSLQTSTPTTIDGTVVAAVVTGVLLCVAAGAARYVVARYRREREQDLVPAGGEQRYLDVVDEKPLALVPDVDAGNGTESRKDALRREAEDSEQGAPAEERQQPAATEPVELQLAGLQALVPDARSSTWDGRQEASLGGGSPLRPLASPLLETSSFPAPAHDAPSENIFDRRAARRVPYVQSAWLWWGDADEPVTVQDISATGLRLRFPGSGSTRGPALGQAVRIVFPVSGTTVEASSRVQWRRTVDGGSETGLQFLGLAARDQELIQELLLAVQ